MSRILVLYYSAYGHVETMADAVVEGARGVSGTEVAIRRVPELMPKEALESSGAKVDQDAPVIEDPNELADYDAIVFGTPTRFGNMCSGLPYSSAELADVSGGRGGSPYGAATIAGPEGKRVPSDAEKKLATDQGARVAEITAKLHG